MQVGLIYHTKDYHKLVEMTARECYQSYAKVGEESHNFIKGIMGAGHISIASTGNIVFGISGFTGLEEYAGVLTDLVTMKEINNYIRWTTPDSKQNPDTKVGVIVSMNMLTFLDIERNIKNYDVSSQLWESFLRLFNRVPEMKWFINDKIKLQPIENQYVAKPEPELYKPVILTEDYTELKAKGLSDHELDIHATITLNLKVDRATGLQIWRHADMAGGTELSQRYVKRDGVAYRPMLGFEQGEYPDFTKYLANHPHATEQSARDRFDSYVRDLDKQLENSIHFYTAFRDDLVDIGVRLSRAKEIARAALPNATTTKLINCRPLRQWKHFLNLRDTTHAQAEIRKDSQAIKEVFDEVGIKYE